MAKLTKEKILKLGAIEVMVLCSEHSVPEGTRDEMVKALLEHFGFKED